MIDALVITPATMLSLSCVMLGIWAVAVGARDWTGRWQWRGDGPLGWPLHRLSGGRLRQSSLAASLFAPQGIGALGLVRVAAGAALIVQPQAWALPVALLLLIIVQLLRSPRLPADGGEKLAQAVAAGGVMLWIGIDADSRPWLLAGTVWTGGQLVIAYFGAGLSKLLLRRWRNGEAPYGALSSFTHGRALTARFVADPWRARLFGWAVMLPELLFPLALLLPIPWLVAVLLGFLCFHLAIVWVMDLVSYPLAFAAAYPFVALLSIELRQLLGWV